jgi:hypothetical protein
MATIGQRIVNAPCCSSMRANELSSRVSGTTILRQAKASVICMRKKLANASGGKDYIETVWGRGYVMREHEQAEAKISA